MRSTIVALLLFTLSVFAQFGVPGERIRSDQIQWIYGPTAQRHTNPPVGFFYYNTDSSFYQYYNGSSWIDMTDLTNFTGTIGDTATVLRNEFDDTIAIYLTNFANDSLSASNGIVYSGRDFGQKTIKNIAALEAYDADSLGTTVYLRELTSGGYGGGEMVYVDSTDLRARIGSAVPDSVIIFHAPKTDRVWYRKQFDHGILNTEWAGTKGDNSANDSLGFARAIATAKKFGTKNVYVPTGVYKYTGSILLTATINNNDHLRFFGDGIGATILDPTDDVSAIRTSVGGTYDFNIDIMGMTILGPGSGSSTAAAIEYDSTSFGVIENVRVNGFYYGFWIQQCNTVRVLRNRIEDCYIGMLLGPNAPNEFSLQNNYISRCDSLGINIQGNSKGGSIVSGAFISNPINIRVGTGATVTMIGVNQETTSEYCYYIEGDASMTTINSTGVTNTGNLAFVGNQGRLVIIGDAPDDSVYAVNTNAYVVHFGTRSPITVKNTAVTPNVTYEAGLWESRQDNSIVSAASTRRGQLQYIYQRTNTDPSDNLIITTQKNDSTWFNNYILDGTDLRFSITGSQPGRVGNIRLVGGSIAFTATNNTDSTKVAAVLDTMGYGTIYPIMAQIDFDDSTKVSTEYNWNVTTLDQNTVTRPGRVLFLVHHPNLTSGNQTARLRYLALFVATKSW